MGFFPGVFSRPVSSSPISTNVLLAAACGVAWFVPPAAAQLVINEVYYDHPGTDRGHEFVEVYNAAPTPVPLAGVSLEFHNGSGEGWEPMWRFQASDTLDAGALVVVGGGLVAPAPDVVLDFSLQNGPDAVAVFESGRALDVVGYGGLDAAGYSEGAGALPVPAGASISRIPDGRDTGDNRADFAQSRPTPGRYNVARRDVAVVLADPTRIRDVLGSGEEWLDVGLENRGMADVSPLAVALSVWDSTETSTSPVGVWRNASAVPPGGSEVVTVPLVLSPGYHWVTLSLELIGDERDDNDSLVVVRRVGSLGLLVSEVLSHPRAPCPQFVELYNAGVESRWLRGFALRDRSHAAVTTADADSVRIDPGAFAVVAEDADGLRSCFSLGDAVSVVGVSGTWPTFNRSGTPVADSVVVLDRYGLVVDAVAIPPVPSSAAGRSIERVNLFSGAMGATWMLSADPAGASPGRAGVRAVFEPPPPGKLHAHPNPFFPARGDVLVVTVDAEGVDRAVGSVFDAIGRRVADLGVATAFPAVFLWSGEDGSGTAALPGIYIIACELFRDGGGEDVLKVVVGCGRDG